MCCANIDRGNPLVTFECSIHVGFFPQKDVTRSIKLFVVFEVSNIPGHYLIETLINTIERPINYQQHFHFPVCSKTKGALIAVNRITSYVIRKKKKNSERSCDFRRKLGLYLPFKRSICFSQSAFADEEENYKT